MGGNGCPGLGIKMAHDDNLKRPRRRRSLQRQASGGVDVEQLTTTASDVRDDLHERPAYGESVCQDPSVNNGSTAANTRAMKAMNSRAQRGTANVARSIRALKNPVGVEGRRRRDYGSTCPRSGDLGRTSRQGHYTYTGPRRVTWLDLRATMRRPTNTRSAPQSTAGDVCGELQPDKRLRPAAANDERGYGTSPARWCRELPVRAVHAGRTRTRKPRRSAPGTSSDSTSNYRHVAVSDDAAPRFSRCRTTSAPSIHRTVE